MTDRSIPWDGVYNYLANLADAKLSAADYAIKVRQLYDVLFKEARDREEVREFFLFHLPIQRISAEHRDLALKLLPKAPARKCGRPRGASNKATYTKKYKLYQDWIYEKSLNPALTKEQFARKRLGITDENLDGEYGIDHRFKVDALLQELKPGRMKQMDEGQRRALETIYPLVIKEPRKNFAREWREAKRNCPVLTKEQFVRDDLGCVDGEITEDMVRRQLEYLEQGEQLLTDS